MKIPKVIYCVVFAFVLSISAGKKEFTYFNKLPVDLQRAIFLQAGNAYEQLQLIDAFLLVSKRLNKRIFGYGVPRKKGKVVTVGAEIELESKNALHSERMVLFDYATKVVVPKKCQNKDSFLEQYYMRLAKLFEKYLKSMDLGYQVYAQFPLSACSKDGNAIALRVFMHPRFKKFLIRTQRWRIRPGINSGKPGWICKPIIGPLGKYDSASAGSAATGRRNTSLIEILNSLPGKCILEGLSTIKVEGKNGNEWAKIKMLLPDKLVCHDEK